MNVVVKPVTAVFDPVVVEGDALRLRSADQTTRPLLFSNGVPVRSLLPGWRAILLHAGLRDILLLELEHADGHRVTWFLTPDGRQLADRIEALSADHVDMLRAAAWRLPGLAAGAAGALSGVARRTREAIRALLVPHVVPDPVVQLADALFVICDDDAQPRPLRDPQGGAVASFLPGWGARLLYTGFAPLLLLELTGPGREARIWFLDASGRRIADRVQDLPAAMRAHVRKVGGGWLGQAALDGAACVAAAAGFGLLHWEARLELEALFEVPGAAAFAEADQRAMAFAADGIDMRELARIDPADHRSMAAFTGARLWDGQPWITAGGCSLALPILPAARHYCIRVDLADIRAERDISVLLDGRLLARARVAVRTHPRGSRMLVWLPAERLSIAASELRLHIEPVLGGAAPTADDGDVCRLASLIVLGGGAPPPGRVQAGSPSERDLLLSFESLGDNCEFGFMQRHCGL